MTAATPSLPVAEGLFTWPDAPHLVGGSCRACGTTTFPTQASCPRCTGTDVRRVALAGRGRLWTWTIQGFEPKPPYAAEGTFAPYGVGYVELAAEEEGASAVLVEGRLTESRAGRLAIGTEMDVVFVPFRHDADGNEIVTFAFRPAGSPAHT
jgi:uncharacterized OB-fold protein